MYASVVDWYRPFSSMPYIAELFQMEGWDEMPIVADQDFVTSGVAENLDRPIYAVRGNRFQTFVKWDLQRIEATTGEQVLECIKYVAELYRSDVIVILNYRLTSRELKFQRWFAPTIDTREVFFIYRYTYQPDGLEFVLFSFPENRRIPVFRRYSQAEYQHRSHSLDLIPKN